jgi:hypothetical protein
VTSLLYDTCDRCGGDGYQPVAFTKHLYRYPCRGCKGTGAKSLTEGNY